MATTSSSGFQNSQDSMFSIKYRDSWLDIDIIDHLLKTEKEENLFRKYNFN